jgi:hypothetical protein
MSGGCGPTVSSSSPSTAPGVVTGGEFAIPFEQARPGPVPAEHGSPSRGVDPGLLISTEGVAAYRLKVRWFTELDEKSCFARWLLIPSAAGH